MEYSLNYDTFIEDSYNSDSNYKLNEIIELKDLKKAKVYETLSFNIQSLNLDELKRFLIDDLEELKEKGEIKLSTELRRLLLLYDILKNTKGTTPNH